jgi:hypothetical protein
MALYIVVGKTPQGVTYLASFGGRGYISEDKESAQLFANNCKHDNPSNEYSVHSVGRLVGKGRSIKYTEYTPDKPSEIPPLPPRWLVGCRSS